eukprot:CAMPEP_0168515708 /NCGR_PEP_ID=MMETSP0405-20121227/4951_1 /TAXON_ID=498012 /ORGANISM="Trichosphaerium sp, Strain Am-I-7 wt" /LENGTH=77 /DNA_ID=CAMNT_0008535247 /DNA_START=45 /DNA_END=278 /DNA_ORIENTATION=-
MGPYEAAITDSVPHSQHGSVSAVYQGMAALGSLAASLAGLLLDLISRKLAYLILVGFYMLRKKKKKMKTKEKNLIAS